MGDTVTSVQPVDSSATASRLGELANDLWWTWNTQARERLPAARLPAVAADRAQPGLMLRLISNGDAGRRGRGPRVPGSSTTAPSPRWTGCAPAARPGGLANFPDAKGPLAYFSAEFALHQSLPIYAGGLGVLAGDHCKEASDLGVPLIGVGFMYPQGYFHQTVSPEGWQQEVYERLSWSDAPVDPALTPDGKPCVIAVPLGNRTVLAAVWRVRLGRVTLYLLDTDLEENTPWDRELSARLYGGDREIRDPAGNHPRHRRRPRAEGARADARAPGT